MQMYLFFLFFLLWSADVASGRRQIIMFHHFKAVHLSAVERLLWVTRWKLLNNVPPPYVPQQEVGGTSNWPAAV
jgi:hypothetical protein